MSLAKNRRQSAMFPERVVHSVPWSNLNAQSNHESAAQCPISRLDLPLRLNL